MHSQHDQRQVHCGTKGSCRVSKLVHLSSHNLLRCLCILLRFAAQTGRRLGNGQFVGLISRARQSHVPSIQLVGLSGRYLVLWGDLVRPVSRVSPIEISTDANTCWCVGAVRRRKGKSHHRDEDKCEAGTI